MKMVSTSSFCSGCMSITFDADVFRAISEAISIVSARKHDPFKAHERIKTFYDWAQIAERTENVYDTVMKSEQRELWDRILRYVVPKYQDFWRQLLIELCNLGVMRDLYTPSSYLSTVCSSSFWSGGCLGKIWILWRIIGTIGSLLLWVSFYTLSQYECLIDVLHRLLAVGPITNKLNACRRYTLPMWYPI